MNTPSKRYQEEQAMADKWVAVPVEPTEEMLEAATSAFEQAVDEDMPIPYGSAHIYQAMLAAAPKPETTETREGYWWCQNCKTEVGPYHVTYTEHHEECGHPVEWIEPAAPKPDDEIARLVQQAIDYMIDDWYEHYSAYRNDGWIDSAKHTSSGFVTAMRIIELKGKLEHHPEHPEWVRVKEEGK